MDKLEEDVFKEFDCLCQALIAELKTASKENRGIDLGNFTTQLSQSYMKLNTSFRDVRIRLKDKKSGSIF